MGTETLTTHTGPPSMGTETLTTHTGPPSIGAETLLIPNHPVWALKHYSYRTKVSTEALTTHTGPPSMGTETLTTHTGPPSIGTETLIPDHPVWALKHYSYRTKVSTGLTESVTGSLTIHLWNRNNFDSVVGTQLRSLSASDTTNRLYLV